MPGTSIVIPERLDQVHGTEQDLDALRRSYLRNAADRLPVARWAERDVAFLAEDTGTDADWIRANAPAGVPQPAGRETTP